MPAWNLETGGGLQTPKPWPVLLAGLAWLMVATTSAQPAPCDQGIIQLPARINGTITVCSALAAQVPALNRQLQEINKSLAGQEQQLAELTRLVRGVNSVSQNLGVDRQAQLIRNLFSQLQVSQQVSAQQTERQMAVLADGFDRLRDQLLGALTNRATADSASAAIEGPLGDAIAQLDLSGAETLLADIRAQLKAIGGQVAEVNRRTGEIQRTLDQQMLDLPRVSAAVAAGDTTALQSMTAAGLRATVLEEALRQTIGNSRETVSFRFFENAAASGPAMEWFDGALAAGLDPNMTVPSEYYRREGLLIAALRAGNAAAIKTLLKHGAAPHAYQDLSLTEYPDPRLLFPLKRVADDDRYSVREKQELAAAFIAAGVVIPPVVTPPDPTSWPSVMYAAREFRDRWATVVGQPLPTSPKCCEPPSAVCRQLSRPGKDWCQAVRSTPKRLDFVRADSNRDPPFVNVELQFLLSIDKERLWFLGLESWRQDYVIVDMSHDGSAWAVTTFRYVGRYTCRADGDHTRDYCWQRVPLTRTPGSGTEVRDRSNNRWQVGGGPDPTRPPG